MTLENDIVLIYMEEMPLAFARVEHITADPKPEWFQVTLLILAVPLKTVTWILREAYINGTVFTMEGKSMRLEKIEAPSRPPETESAAKKDGEEQAPVAGKKTAEVISFPAFPPQK